VADNDYLESAKAVTLRFAAESKISVRYCIEPRQNIALARNMVVANADVADFLAFIDDDEFVPECWLLTLFKAWNEYRVDGVLGPVRPYFEQQPPKWVIAGRFYQRTTYPTGYIIDWSKGRTGNVLLRRELFTPEELPFRAEFRTGEDQDFFRRMISKGRVFIWCDEALAYEVVSPIRWKRRFLIKRALLQGATSIPSRCVAFSIAKSGVAVCAYIMVLPFALVRGQHHLMMLLIKLFHHIGNLLAAMGITPIKAPYVTD
jgi:glycosyltransferase involved in cell wall biosynthesis